MWTEAVIVGIVIGLVQAIKKTNIIADRFIPLVSVIIGLLITFVSNITGGQVEWVQYGLMFGLMAAGLFDVGNKTVLGK